MRGEANNRQADINDRLLHVLPDLSPGFELESTVTQWFTSGVKRAFATPQSSDASVQLHGQNVIN